MVGRTISDASPNQFLDQAHKLGDFSFHVDSTASLVEVVRLAKKFLILGKGTQNSRRMPPAELIFSKRRQTMAQHLTILGRP